MHHQVYIYLNSSSHLEFFPDNSSNKFTSLLPEGLRLEGDWEVGLVQIQYPASRRSAEVTFQTDIIEDTIFEDTKRPVLRKINLVPRAKSLTFHPVFYKPVKNPQINEISIYIYNNRGELHSFTGETLKCTLHFRKCLLNG